MAQSTGHAHQDVEAGPTSRRSWVTHAVLIAGAVLALAGLFLVVRIEFYVQAHSPRFDAIPETPIGWTLFSVGLVVCLAVELYVRWPSMLARGTIVSDEPSLTVSRRVSWLARRVLGSLVLSIPVAVVLGGVVWAVFQISRGYVIEVVGSDPNPALALIPLVFLAPGLVFAFFMTPLFMDGPGPLRVGNRARWIIVGALFVAWVGLFAFVAIEERLTREPEPPRAGVEEMDRLDVEFDSAVSRWLEDQIDAVLNGRGESDLSGADRIAISALTDAADTARSYNEGLLCDIGPPIVMPGTAAYPPYKDCPSIDAWFQRGEIAVENSGPTIYVELPLEPSTGSPSTIQPSIASPTTTMAVTTTVHGQPVSAVVASRMCPLGWCSGADWFSAGDFGAPPARAGLRYRVVRLGDPIFESVGPEIPARCNPDGEPIGMSFDPPIPGGFGELDAVAVSGDGEVLPYKVEILPATMKAYEETTRELLVELGLEVPVVVNTQVVRTDLEGDGVDEVLVAATQVAGSNRLPGVVGDYSLVYLRRLVDGAVETTILAHHVVVQESPDPFSGGVFEISAVADLNYDGTMEIVLSGDVWEGSVIDVWENIDAHGPVMVLSCRCGL